MLIFLRIFLSILGISKKEEKNNAVAIFCIISSIQVLLKNCCIFLIYKSCHFTFHQRRINVIVVSGCYVNQRLEMQRRGKKQNCKSTNFKKTQQLRCVHTRGKLEVFVNSLRKNSSAGPCQHIGNMQMNFFVRN